LLLAGCSGGGSTSPPDPTAAITRVVSAGVTLDYFGYAAIVCGHDDPFDSENKTDYSDEVQAFTNANQVCVSGDMQVLENRLRKAASAFTPILYVEPVFFSFSANMGDMNPDAEALWADVRGAISASGVPSSDIVFYLVDEPTLRSLPLSDVSYAADIIRRDYPSARIMMIEAYHGPDAPIIPNEIDIWGFNAYTIRDPGSDSRYTNYLDLASDRLMDHQSLAIIMDAQHTPFHQSAGLLENDMAEVARNYLALARSRDDVSIMLGYTWAGGIDNLDEKGVRDLPQVVIDAHREIGRDIISK